MQRSAERGRRFEAQKEYEESMGKEAKRWEGRVMRFRNGGRKEAGGEGGGLEKIWGRARCSVAVGSGPWKLPQIVLVTPLGQLHAEPAQLSEQRPLCPPQKGHSLGRAVRPEGQQMVGGGQPPVTPDKLACILHLQQVDSAVSHQAKAEKKKSFGACTGTCDQHLPSG